MVNREISGSDEKTIGLSDGSGDGEDPPIPSDPSPSREKDSGYGNAIHGFDTGLQAWLQVVGAFLLFFNSW